MLDAKEVVLCLANHYDLIEMKEKKIPSIFIKSSRRLAVSVRINRFSVRSTKRLHTLMRLSFRKGHEDREKNAYFNIVRNRAKR